MAKQEKSKHKGASCMCTWEKCSFFSQQIQQFANEDDVWNGGILLVKKQQPNVKSKKNAVLRASIMRNVPGFADKEDVNTFYIARHHFPRALHEFNITRGCKRMTIYLNETQVQYIAKKEDNARLLEKCNTVNSLLKSIGCEIDSATVGMYVQAPVVPMGEVVTFVTTLTSERASRTRNRLVKVTKPPPEVPQIASAVSPTIHGNNATTLATSVPTFTDDHRNDHSPAGISYDIVTPSTQKDFSAMVATKRTPDVPSVSATGPFSPQAKHYSSTTMSPDLLPSADICQSKIKTKYEYYTKRNKNDISALEGDRNFDGALFLLRTRHSDFQPIKMYDGTWFYPCSDTSPPNSSNSKCKKFCLKKRLLSGNGLCGPCFHQKKMASRREKNCPTDLALGSRRPIGSIPPIVLQQISRMKSRAIKTLKQRVNRLNQKLDQYKDKITIDPKDPVRILLKKTFEIISNNRDNVREQIIAALLEIKAGEKLKSTQKEQNEFAEHIIREIDNTAKRMSGEDTQVRYSPKTIRLALALWLRDNKAYEEFQKSSLSIYPSIRHLKGIKNAMKCREGNDPKCYGRFKDEQLVGQYINGLIGHLLFDEIKLILDIVFNCQSNDVVGFVSNGIRSTLSLKEELYKLCYEDDISDENFNKQPAMYANQFRFRSAVSKVVHNAEFFFNSGNLSGDETLRQLMLVITGYEMIGCKIFGLCCDAGGSNAALMKILRKGIKLNGGWLSIDMVSFVNHMDPTRLVYAWTCATHNHKALRNSEFRSRNGGTRDFVRLEDNGTSTSFGWKQKENAFHRDQKAIKNGTTTDTDLTMQAIQPDKWSIMNYSLAKAVYSDKTISGMFSFAGSDLLCLDEMYQKKIEGTPRSKFQCYLSVLQDHAKVGTVMRQAFRSLEYSVAVNGIFIDRLANKEFQITLENIDEEEKKMIDHLSFFEKWAKEIEIHEKKYKEVNNNNNNNKEKTDDKAPWKKHFLADQTYINIRIGIAGFFHYARAVLSVQNGPKYVPGLHANQSSLEALFSWLRSMGRDTTSKYAAGVSSRNAINTIKSQNVLKGNRMYNQEDIGEEEEDPATEGTAAQNKARREKMFQSWLLPDDGVNIKEEFQSWVCHTNGDMGAMIYDDKMIHTGLLGGSIRMEIQKEMRLSKKHFSTYFLTNTIFQEYAQLSINTPSQNWFQSFCKMNEEDNRKFDDCCRNILEHLWGCLRLSASASVKREPVQSSYHYHMLSYLQENKFVQIIESMPEGMRIRHPCCVVTQLLSNLLMHDWIPSACNLLRERKIRERASDDTISEEEITARERKIVRLKEVNRFFGWAVFSLIKRLRKELQDGCKKDNPQEIDEETTHNEINFLEELRTFEERILDDDAYLQTYYYPSDRLYNNGWLTLVSPKYAAFALEVCNVVADSLDTKAISRRGNACVKLAKELVKEENQESKRIRKEFLNLSKESSIPEEGRLKLLECLLEKTMNARIGFTFRHYKSNTTGRGGTSENSTAFRPDLKTKAAPKKRKAEDMLKE